eukprot:3770058-Prymnesium_polylepis.2
MLEGILFHQRNFARNLLKWAPKRRITFFAGGCPPAPPRQSGTAQSDVTSTTHVPDPSPSLLGVTC